jgi:hypothetical protein
MKKKICPREDEVLKALHEEKMSEELQEHIAGCSACQKTEAVNRWMHRFRESAWHAEMREKTLPDAQTLWNKVHAKRRPDKKLVRKALRPLMIYQVLFYGLLTAGIIYAVIWGFGKFGYILDNPVIATIIPFFGIMMMIVIISLSFCAVVAAFDRRKHPV